jgi:hypothetical protein
MCNWLQESSGLPVNFFSEALLSSSVSINSKGLYLLSCPVLEDRYKTGEKIGKPGAEEEEEVLECLTLNYTTSRK